MFVVTIESADASVHSLQIDADAQKVRFEDAGHTNVEIVEKDTFEPPQPE